MSRPNKYRAVPVVVDGVRFASKREARRWAELCLLQRAGEITALVRQPRYMFRHGGALIGWYTADFGYVDMRTGRVVVEDVKSPATRRHEAYRLRKRMMRVFYDIEILET